MGEREVNKTIASVCLYLQENDKNGSYIDMIEEVKTGELTEAQAANELERLLTMLVSEFNDDEDKQRLSEIKELQR